MFCPRTPAVQHSPRSDDTERGNWRASASMFVRVTVGTVVCELASVDPRVATKLVGGGGRGPRDIARRARAFVLPGIHERECVAAGPQGRRAVRLARRRRARRRARPRAV
jgi:hypothetical protein